MEAQLNFEINIDRWRLKDEMRHWRIEQNLSAGLHVDTARRS